MALHPQRQASTALFRYQSTKKPCANDKGLVAENQELLMHSFGSRMLTSHEMPNVEHGIALLTHSRTLVGHFLYVDHR